MGDVISLDAFRKSKKEAQPQKAEANVPATTDAALPAVVQSEEGYTVGAAGEEKFNYPLMLRYANLGIMRSVLLYVEKHGSLPASSQLWISFETGAPNVTMPDWLRQKYPVAMQIVLDKWWKDLVVEPDGFGVTLNFGDEEVPLVIPFSAVFGFVDPAADFGFYFKAMA